MNACVVNVEGLVVVIVGGGLLVLSVFVLEPVAVGFLSSLPISPVGEYQKNRGSNSLKMYQHNSSGVI